MSESVSVHKKFCPCGHLVSHHPWGEYCTDCRKEKRFFDCKKQLVKSTYPQKKGFYVKFGKVKK